MLLVLTVVLGLLYPLAVWGVGQLALRDQANGSVVTADGHVVGSSLIGQASPTPRQPAAAVVPAPAVRCRRTATTRPPPGVEPGPNNSDLLDQVEERRAAAAAQDGVDPASVPPDAVTASGSGLDPDISPAYADLQVARVARARGLPRPRSQSLVAAHRRARAGLPR